MSNLSPTNPVGFLWLHARARLRSVGRSDEGATVVEWVLISALLLIMAGLAYGIISIAVQGKAQEVSDLLG